MIVTENVQTGSFTGSVNKKFTSLEGCGVKRTLPIFKTKILIYQPRVILGMKILFG